MNLFNSGEFTLNSGKTSFFKVDCDALTDEDIDCLARLIKDNIPLFAWVEGVPTGGLRLAEALKPLTEPDHTSIGLIVDDVMTTGNSMEKQRDGRAAMGVVIFNRINKDSATISPGWIKSIWRMSL